MIIKMQAIINRNKYVLGVILAGFAGIVLLGAHGASTASAETSGRNRSTTYVALGDSVASGLGLPAGFGATAEDQVCGRSSQAYAALVARGLGRMPRVTNVACQGAVVNNLVTPQTVGNTSVQPQLDAAFANGSPDVMTLTAGANDVKWATFIGACFATTCDTEANTNSADALLAALRSNLRNDLAAIQTRSQADVPTVAVTGYYRPMSDRCISSNITASEVAWISLQTDKLNAVIRETAREFNFTKYTAIDFTGHDICSADPWLQRPGVASEPAPFHPNAKGQQAMAQAVLRSLTLTSE